MNIKSLILAAAMCLGAFVAHAADAVVSEDVAPEAVAVSNWSGAYIAGIAGYDWSKAGHEHQNVNTFGGPGGTYDHDGNSFVGGAVVGYNYEFDNRLVIGAELGLQSGVKMDDGDAYAIYHNYTDSKLSYLATAKARIGYDAGAFLPYITGGYAGGKLTSNQVYSPIGSPPTTWSDSKFRSGYTIGAGVDYKITDHWFAGVEYDYVNLGKAHFSGNDSNGTLTQIDAKYTSNQVNFRLGYKF